MKGRNEKGIWVEHKVVNVLKPGAERPREGDITGLDHLTSRNASSPKNDDIWHLYKYGPPSPALHGTLLDLPASDLSGSESGMASDEGEEERHGLAPVVPECCVRCGWFQGG